MSKPEYAPRKTEGQTLISSVPSLSNEMALAIASQHFNLDCDAIDALTSERDQNLLLKSPGGRKFILKVANPAENREVTDFQTRALCHVERIDPGLPVPRVCRTIEGASEAIITLPDGRSSAVRMLTYLDGRPLINAPRSGRQRRNLAQFLARIDFGLRDYEHPGQRHYLQWDITHLDRMAPLVPSVKEEHVRNLVCKVLDDFSSQIVPALPLLRKQVIYNDLNFYNVLVDRADADRITGVIDFGDIVSAPLVNEIAVAMSYQFGDTADKAAASEFLAAYHEALPLTETEARLLPILIEARLALTLLITSYRADRYPENREYILRNNKPAQAALLELRSGDGKANMDWVMEALESTQ